MRSQHAGRRNTMLQDRVGKSLLVRRRLLKRNFVRNQLYEFVCNRMDAIDRLDDEPLCGKEGSYGDSGTCDHKKSVG